MLRGGLRLGRILGIEVHLDWSWVLIFLLVTWNLAAVIFPALHPEWSTGMVWTTAFVAAVMFFGSVLAHELAHSVVAQARGLPVSRITLFLFGGVSNIEREPASPSTEFLMAIVGPLTSLFLGLAFLSLAGASIFVAGRSGAGLGWLRSAGPIATLFLWLGPVNIVLALFNMVPGYPLDGGRVLRSIFWAASRNQRAATRWASWIGQGIAWLFIVAGMAMVVGVRFPLLGRGIVGGLWLVLIGWFLNTAAAAGYRQVLVEEILAGVPVSSLMRADAPSVPPGLSVQSLVYDHLVSSGERSIAVVEEGCLVGIVSLHDVQKLEKGAWETTRVEEVMTPAEELATATPREEVAQALLDLTGRDVRQIPVVQEGRLVGMLRRGDIYKWLSLHSELALR